LNAIWQNAIQNSLIWFEPKECFRREDSKVINRALFDLVAFAAANTNPTEARKKRKNFRETYQLLLSNEEFQDLISRSVDHTKRTKRRFEMWDEFFQGVI
jgi:hypothetical protein